MSQRIFIQCSSSDIPGNPSERCMKLTHLACEAILNRRFTWGLDFLHIQGDFKSENKSCHLLVDCGIKDNITEDLSQIPVIYFRATRNGDTCALVRRQMNLAAILAEQPWGRDKYPLDYKPDKSSNPVPEQDFAATQKI